MNFVDGGISFWAIFVAHIAYEANPVMAALMSVSPYLFLVFKVVMPTISAAVLYKYRERLMRGIRIGTWVLWFCFFMYAGLMVHFGLLIHTAATAGFF